jgi:tetratricopeptide (TPR) repeat protein
LLSQIYTMYERDLSALDRFRRAMREGSEQEQFITALHLLGSGNHKESLIAYEILAKTYEHQKGFCYFKQGDCYLKMEEEEKAIDCYEDALKHGYDADKVDDAIWLACEAAYYKFREIDIVKRYIYLLPEGNSVRYAKSIIDNLRTS